MSNLKVAEFRHAVRIAGVALEEKGFNPTEIRLTGFDMDLFRDSREILDLLTHPRRVTAAALQSQMSLMFMGLKVLDAEPDQASCVIGQRGVHQEASPLHLQLP